MGSAMIVASVWRLWTVCSLNIRNDESALYKKKKCIHTAKKQHSVRMWLGRRSWSWLTVWNVTDICKHLFLNPCSSPVFYDIATQRKTVLFKYFWSTFDVISFEITDGWNLHWSDDSNDRQVETLSNSKNFKLW